MGLHTIVSNCFNACDPNTFLKNSYQPYIQGLLLSLDLLWLHLGAVRSFQSRNDESNMDIGLLAFIAVEEEVFRFHQSLGGFLMRMVSAFKGGLSGRWCKIFPYGDVFLQTTSPQKAAIHNRNLGLFSMKISIDIDFYIIISRIFIVIVLLAQKLEDVISLYLYLLQGHGWQEAFKESREPSC